MPGWLSDDLAAYLKRTCRAGGWQWSFYADPVRPERLKVIARRGSRVVTLSNLTAAQADRFDPERAWRGDDLTR